MTCRAVSEASIDAKLSKLQGVWLGKGGKIDGYSNRILELIYATKTAEHTVSEIKCKLVMLRNLLKDFCWSC